MNLDKIIIKGAKEHHLKNISLEIPKNKFLEKLKVAKSKTAYFKEAKLTNIDMKLLNTLEN